MVREKSTHHEVIGKVAEYAHSIGFEIKNITFSPIKGPEGNIEYLIHLKKCEGQAPPEISIDLESVVEEAFAALGTS